MKKIVKLIIPAVCTVMALSGCASGASAAGKPGNMPRNEAQNLTAVESMKVELSDIANEYMYSGAITPKTEVNVLSTLSGKVAKVNYDVGDRVNKDDVLFVMDTADIQNSINVSKASVASAQAGVNTAETNLELANGASMQTQIENAKNSVTNTEATIKNAEKELETAKTSLSNAEITLNKAKTDYETNLQLYEAGGISKESIDTYKNVYEQAQNSYEQAKISIEQKQLSYDNAVESNNQAQSSYNIVANQTPEENIKKAQDSLAQAKASLASAQAQLASNEKNLTDAVVKSPITGVVLECNATEGAVLSQSQTPFVIIDIDAVYTEINISEQMIPSISVGDEVKIKISSLSNEQLTGNISSISPGADSDGTYKVKIEIPNSDGQIKSGMFAEVYFTKESSSGVVVLPRSAVISKNNEDYVFISDNGTAKRIDVTIGIDNGDEIEITNGLTSGMRVITKGQTYLKDGAAINDVTLKAENGGTAQNTETAQAADGSSKTKSGQPNSGASKGE